MSYTNVIANTRSQSHSIVPETKETTLIERIQTAQGTGKTGSAIRKVAQFIGMDGAPEAPVKASTAPGKLSVDLELEIQQWRASRSYTWSLEDAEKSRRQTDTQVEDAKRAHAFVTSKAILQKLQAPRWTNRDYTASQKFLNYIRKNAAAIEEIERQRRGNDSLGETAKRSIARQTSLQVLSGLQNPALRSTRHLTNQHRMAYSEIIGQAGDLAKKKLLPVAESFAASAYQIGNFAARAAYFFGGKAAVKAQDIGQKAAVQGQTLGSQALAKGQILGTEALAKGQILGTEALAKGQTLGSQALAKGQILGSQAIAGVQSLGEQAQRTALDTAAGAQSVANQTLEKTKDLTHQAQVVASNAIASVQQMGGQAVEKAKELMEFSEPTLSWKQLAAMEEEERSSRIHAQFGSNRFATALHTSALVKDLIISKDQHYSADSEPRRFYGTAILEETERLRRIVSDKASPVARMNAKRAAAIISLYRQQTLGQVRSGSAMPVFSAPIISKESQAQQVAPVRYQAAM